MLFFNSVSLSEDAMEYSKEFVTSVVLGKDLVPRYLSHDIVVHCTLLGHYHSAMICSSLTDSAFLS